MTHHNRPRSAFSLIELLVVLGLIGMLISLLLPAVQSLRGAATRAMCANNIKQLALALHNYHAAHGYLPPRAMRGDSSSPQAFLSWRALILPYIEQESLWQRSVEACRQTSDTYKNPPHTGYTAVLPVLVCPNDSRLLVPLTTPRGDYVAFSSYLGVAGAPWGKGALGGAPGPTLNDFLDGTGSTLLIGERPPPASLQAGQWYSVNWIREPLGGPNSIMFIPGAKESFDLECTTANTMFGPGEIRNPCDRYHFWSLHRGGANFAFADGSVRFLPYSASKIMPALATRAGGEVVDIPW
jgi:prepilin-type processing-associated H-X9-DG protein/prepilin-type N-terminal cleavage/methylation domain-containing protein